MPTPRKFDTMKEAFREMSRIADNETRDSTRKDFVRAVRKFEKAYAEWRALIPEQEEINGHGSPGTVVVVVPEGIPLRTIHMPLMRRR